MCLLHSNNLPRHVFARAVNASRCATSAGQMCLKRGVARSQTKQHFRFQTVQVNSKTFASETQGEAGLCTQLLHAHCIWKNPNLHTYTNSHHITIKNTKYLPPYSSADSWVHDAIKGL
jgi:hypothetical protein